jgi:hypothetical protein
MTRRTQASGSLMRWAAIGAMALLPACSWADLSVRAVVNKPILGSGKCCVVPETAERCANAVTPPSMASRVP